MSFSFLHNNYYSRSYAEDVTSVTSGASQGPHSFNSRSYAEDVTSVTSGASQGPHSFNLVFVCLFVCLFVSRLALSCICPVPYRTNKDSRPQYFCLFVPSACLALSRTCPVPSSVRYHQKNEYILVCEVYRGMHSVQYHFVWICVRGRDPTSRLAGPRVEQPGNRM